MPKAFFVAWLDAAGGGGWTDRKEAAVADLRVESIGWLIAESETSITLSTSLCLLTGDCHDPLTIPRPCIHRMEPLNFG